MAVQLAVKVLFPIVHVGMILFGDQPANVYQFFVGFLSCTKVSALYVAGLSAWFVHPFNVYEIL